jgi:putative ABC transport system permease protein
MFMYLKEILTISYRSIMANKLRTFLTMLGIIIGVGSVIAMIATGEGVQRAITTQIERLGSNLLYIRPARRSRVRHATGYFTLYDVSELRKNCESAVYISPEVEGGARVIYQNRNMEAQIRGVYPFWPEMHNFALVRGNMFGDTENINQMRVAVIGSEVREELFGMEDPIGAEVRINKIPFVVIGQLEAKGASGGGSRDNQILLPFYTAQHRLYGRGDRVLRINAQIRSAEEMGFAIDTITSILRRSHRLQPNQQDDFNIYNQAEFIETQTEVTKTLTLLIASIAFISLIVGGIGIMNIMLVSVTERTREIGLRKAVGARDRDILVQFLLEAVLLSLIGGGIGVLIGAGLTFFLAGLSLWGLEWEAVMPTYGIVLAFGFSVLIGVASGVYPARKAAAMNPIDALRYE